MKDFIRNLFGEFRFDMQDEMVERYFFTNSVKNNSEFYLIDFIQAKHLTNYLSPDSLESLLNDFKKAKSISSDVEKNTSLIICVEVSDLNKSNIENLRKHIWSVEEDEYWFNKNVVLYDRIVLAEFNDHNSIYKSLLEIIEEEDSFNKFAEDIYWSSIYYFAIQLFVKLPFLHLSDLDSEFESIEAILNSKLIDEYKILVNLLDGYEIGEGIEADFDSIEDTLFDTKSSLYDEFINKFKGHNETD